MDALRDSSVTFVLAIKVFLILFTVVERSHTEKNSPIEHWQVVLSLCYGVPQR